MTEDDKQNKPKQRHRLLPEELGLTGRIRKALLDRDMGLTHKIKVALEKTQDKNSEWHLGKYQFIALIVFCILSLAFGYATFFLLIKSFPRQVEFKRVDPYGEEISLDDIRVTQEGQALANPRSLYPGDYTLVVEKAGFKREELAFSVTRKGLVIPVALTPIAVSRPPLRMQISDPLRVENIEPDDIILKSEERTSLKGQGVRPGIYTVVIRKAGYFDKEMQITVREDGNVEEKITLDPKLRVVRFLVEDELKQAWIETEGAQPVISSKEIKLISESGHPVDFQGNVHPGHYELHVARTGYLPYKQKISILPGDEQLDFPVSLVTLPREFAVVPHYTIPPNDPRPDSAYLQPMFGTGIIHLVQNLKTVSQSVRPGRYRLVVEKAAYKRFQEDVFVKPGGTRFEKDIHFIPMTKLVILQILSDYEPDPVVNPDELLIDMRIAKKGYVPVEWGGRLKQALSPEKLEIPVRVDMETIPRRLIAEIKSDMEGEAMVMPDLLSVTRMEGSEPKGQSMHLVHENKFLQVDAKPAQYQLVVEKVGFHKIVEPIMVEPSDQPYVIRKKLVTRTRMLVLKVDSDFAPGVELVPDKMTIRKQGETDRPIEPGAQIKPGNYTLTLTRAGFHDLIRQIEVAPGSQDFEFRSQFQVKSRRLLYDIKGENFEKIGPDLVKMDNSPVNENADVVPKAGYIIEIHKKGYKTWKQNVEVRPSNDPFSLAAVLETLNRRIAFKIEATYPPGQNLLPVDECRLVPQDKGRTGSVTVRGGMEDASVRPGSYQVYLAKAGYQPYSGEIRIEPDDVPFYFVTNLTPKERAVNLEIGMSVPSQEKGIVPAVQLVSEDGTIVRNLTKSGEKIPPNRYNLTVSAPGYKVQTELISIAPSEAAFDLKRILLPEQRALRIVLKAEYPPDTQIFPDRTMLDNQETGSKGAPIRCEIVPGAHTLLIEKAGYQNISKGEFFVPAGVGDYEIEEQMLCVPRVVQYKMYDADSGAILAPNSITLNGRAVTGANTFSPGKHQLLVRIEGYEDYTEKDLEIPPAEGPFRIERPIRATSRLVVYELKGDFSSAALTPAEISLNGVSIVKGDKSFSPGDYSLVVFVPGYERLTDERVSINVSREKFVVRRNLVAKNRPVRFDVTGSFPKGAKIQPDKVTFGTQILVEGEKIKPIASGYQVTVEKEGYRTFVRNTAVEPSEDPFVLNATLEARPRRLDLQVDGDYAPGKMLSGVEVNLNGAAYDGTRLLDPGDYAISLAKPGYDKFDFRDTLWPSDLPYVVRKTLLSTPRPVEVTVKSNFGDQQQLVPSVLQFSGKDIAAGSAWKPGRYELSIECGGYQGRKEMIDIEPGIGPVTLERSLTPNNRVLKTSITYDIPPGEVPLGPTKIRMRDMGGVNMRVVDGDQLAPGDYTVNIEKEAYEVYEQPTYVEAAEGPFVLSAQLQAKAVQLLMKIAYDIEPPAGIEPIVVTLIDSTGIGRVLGHGNWIRPGPYSLDIAQPGYEFRTPKQPIRIDPQTKPYLIDRNLYAKQRTLSFDMIYVQDGVPTMVRAVQVLVDQREVTPNENFSPGKKYNVIAKFKGFRTAASDITIPPGEGPMVVDVKLQKLEPYEMYIGRRYADTNGGTLVDDIRVMLELFADNERVEPHQIQYEAGPGGMTFVKFFAPPQMHSLQVVSGFYFDREFKKASYRFVDLRNINADRLVDHLGQISADRALSRLEKMLRDRQDQEKLRNLGQEGREKLTNFLRGLEGTEEERNRKLEVLRLLQDLK